MSEKGTCFFLANNIGVENLFPEPTHNLNTHPTVWDRIKSVGENLDNHEKSKVFDW